MNGTRPTRLVSAVAGAALLLASCASSGASDGQAAASPSNQGSVQAQEGGSGQVQARVGGVRVVSPAEAAVVQNDPPAGLQIIDVRTPEEFTEGHLGGATMIDFYADDFVDRIAELDRDVPYLIYCRSGNRSGQTRALMAELGFTDVVDVDGGIIAWTEADLEIVR